MLWPSCHPRLTNGGASVEREFLFSLDLAFLSTNPSRSKLTYLGTNSWIGLAFGIIAWLVTASTLNSGEVNIDTTFQDYPMLAGNLASLGVSSVAPCPAHFRFLLTFLLRSVGSSQSLPVSSGPKTSILTSLVPFTSTAKEQKRSSTTRRLLPMRI